VARLAFCSRDMIEATWEDEDPALAAREAGDSLPVASPGTASGPSPAVSSTFASERSGDLGSSAIRSSARKRPRESQLFRTFCSWVLSESLGVCPTAAKSRGMQDANARAKTLPSSDLSFSNPRTMASIA